VETLAGFLLAQLGHIPNIGESMEYDGRRYIVAEMTGRRINRVRVENLTGTPDSAGQQELVAGREGGA
jgi:CBS domain containing-hemolysin-like protein